MSLPPSSEGGDTEGKELDNRGKREKGEGRPLFLDCRSEGTLDAPAQALANLRRGLGKATEGRREGSAVSPFLLLEKGGEKKRPGGSELTTPGDGGRTHQGKTEKKGLGTNSGSS